MTQSNDKMVEVSKQIQDLLESNEMALQPFMQYSEFGISPRVRLVSTSEKNDKATDTAETSGDSTGDGTPESDGAQSSE